jgi:hypothetical protein
MNLATLAVLLILALAFAQDRATVEGRVINRVPEFLTCAWI